MGFFSALVDDGGNINQSQIRVSGKTGQGVDELMAARRAVGAARMSGDKTAEDGAHRDVNEAKIALGERGPVWWDDGAPDLNRRMVKNTPYAGWFERLGQQES